MGAQRPKLPPLPQLTAIDPEDSKSVFEAVRGLINAVGELYHYIDVDLRDLESRVTALEP